MEYQNKKEKFEKEIYTLNIKYNTEKERFKQHYKMLINKKITKQKFQAIQENFEKVKKKLKKVEEEKLKCGEQYRILLKLNGVSKKELDFSEIIDYTEKIFIYQEKRIAVKLLKVF